MPAHIKTFALSFALAAILPLPAAAQQCGGLRLINALPITLDENSKPLIPVTIDGKPKFLLFDTGGAIGTIKPSVVKEFKLVPRRDSPELFNAYGDKLDRRVALPTLLMGRIRGNAWGFVVEPEGFDYSNDPSVGGTLAPDVFRQFDIDLDFAAKKLNLFSPDHCQGKVLYWQAKTVAIVPMDLKTSGHIFVQATLDGKRLNALIDTGSSHTVMNANTARVYFGLNATSPGMEKVKNTAAGLEHQVRRFKVLNFEGVAIANPMVEILPDLTKKAMPFNPGSMVAPEEPAGLPDLIIGQSVLAKLHVYIAYRERKLYLTEGGTTASALPK